MNVMKAALIVLTASVTLALAIEPVDRSTWLGVGDRQPGNTVETSVLHSSDAGQEILVTLPGAFRSAVTGTDGKQYVQFHVPGCGATADRVGLPEMPFKGFLVEVPYGVEVSLNLLDEELVSLGTGYRVYPQQPPLPDVAGVDPPSFEIDEEAYATDGFFPPSPVALGHPGFIRGRRVVFVQVFPLRYNPATTEVHAFAHLNFGLIFSGKADPAGLLERQRLANTASETLASQLILNYEAVVPASRQSARGLSTGPAADYLIIVADDFAEEIAPLAEWKHRKGYITRVVPMSEVGSTYTDVKDYIQDAYDTWSPAPWYVLLVGDHTDVPSHDIVGHPYYLDPNYTWPSDHPYACLDDGDPPFLPDVMLGRISVGTEAEATTVADKVLAYERTPDMGDWYDDFLTAAYFQDRGDNSVADRWFMETAMTVYDFMINEKGWMGYTALCTTNWPLTYPVGDYHFRNDSYDHRAEINQLRWGCAPGAYPDPVPTWIVNLWTSATDARDDVTDAVNAGAGHALHRDHGGETGWSHPPFYVSQVEALTNGARTPVVFSINCLTGAFDYAGGNCFAEALQKHSAGGAAGIVAATRESYSGYNDHLAHGIYDALYPEYDTSFGETVYSNSPRPAEALAYGKYYMWHYEGAGGHAELTFNLFHWFGDPEMMLRTTTPMMLSVDHPSSVAQGVPVDITVVVEHDSSPVEGGRATISHPAVDEHWTGLTDADGSITFTGITLTQADPYDLVVSVHNAVPYEGTIDTYPPSDPFSCEPEEDWIQLIEYSRPPGGGAQCWWVGDNANCPTADGMEFNPFCTIDEAVEEAVAGDHVVVKDKAGEYVEPWQVYVNKTIVIRSENGPANCRVRAGDGGTVFFLAGGNPEVQGFTITGSTVDWPVDITGSGVATIRGNILEYNGRAPVHASGYGAIVIGNIIRHNDLPFGSGGGILVDQGDAQIQGNCICRNKASSGDGGGIYISGADAVSLEGNLIALNEAEWGGGIYCKETEISITDCMIGMNNCEYNGGGIHVDRDIVHQAVSMANCALWGNVATYNGGGLSTTGPPGKRAAVPLDVVNCLFVGNQANGPVGGGGALIAGNFTSTITNSTIADNCAAKGGGISVIGSLIVDVNNGILWGNDASEGPQYYGGAFTFMTSIVDQDGASGTCVWRENPGFRSPRTECPATALGDYRLASDSPVIDAGDDDLVPAEITTDLDGGPRFIDYPLVPNDKCPSDVPPGVVDLGPYECAECDDDDDCDDDLFCTGAETCEDGICLSSGDPCPPEQFCNEKTDTCMVCDPIIGACCDPETGDCYVTAECICDDWNGIFLGDGVTCSFCDGGPNVGLECDDDTDCPGASCFIIDCPDPFGACCDPDGGCTEVPSEADCVNGVFLGYGIHCDPNCCPQPELSGSEDCSGFTIIPLIEVPGIGQPPVTVTFTGDNSGVTGPDSCGDDYFTPGGGSDPGWWEAFHLDDCALVRLDFCCSDPVRQPVWTFLYDECPCGEEIPANAVPSWPYPAEGTGYPFCDEDNPWFTFGPLPAGVYFYPVYSAPDGQFGEYQLHVTVEACPIAACCTGDTCQLKNQLECEDSCGYYLAPPNKHIANVACFPQTCATGICCTGAPGCWDGSTKSSCDLDDGRYFGGARCDDPVDACDLLPEPPEDPPAGPMPKNRYISFVPGNAGTQTALRVTFTDLPAPFGSFEGEQKWVGPPWELCEDAGGRFPPCSAGSVQVATLQCTPYYHDWGSIGTIHVYGHDIVPSAVYTVEAIEQGCFSLGLDITTSKWGDVVGNCASTPCTPPNGIVDFSDITAVLDKFKNLPGAPSKPRADIDPNTPDGDVDFTDITRVVDAFRGFPYPFSGPTSCP